MQMHLRNIVLLIFVFSFAEIAVETSFQVSASAEKINDYEGESVVCCFIWLRLDKEIVEMKEHVLLLSKQQR